MVGSYSVGAQQVVQSPQVTLKISSPIFTRDTTPIPDGREQFHTYQTATDELNLIAATYPLITRLYSLGQSVQGRTIWGMKITDNPDIEEYEPEFRICGLHHGNEYMSMEIALTMCNYLTQNYGTNPTVTNLVNNRETWIIPMVNPDGLVLQQRYNYNGVDLNRDYGYVWGTGWGSPSPYSQPETRAVRDHAFANQFGLSFSFHTAALYINYLWNYKAQRTPDNTFILELSNDYRTYTGYTVIEGYDWYQTRGDTNDFSYGCRGDWDWTIETPNSNIASVTTANRNALLDMMTQQDTGLKGIVTDATTGAPVKGIVWVDEKYWPCYTDPVVGDYHRLLLPGDYTVHFRANGYQEQMYNVHIADVTPVELNVQLQPGGPRFAYQIFWANIYDPYPQAGGSNFINNPTEVISALGPTDGKFASLGKGGSVSIDMAESGEIMNGPGNDFTVTEAITPEGYSVYVASSGEYGVSWVSLGSATGNASFDLSTGGVQRARYVKIVDDNVGSATEQNPGFDLDSIQTLHAVQDATFVLSGDCYYPDLSPTSPVSVDVVNLNTNYRWQATTNNNHYSVFMYPGLNINASETLRIMARDSLESVNVTDHVLTTGEISAGSFVFNPLLRVHYRDLKSFPFYQATSDTGAAIAQMMLNYLWWNSTLNPQGPPLHFSDQTALFNSFNTNGGLYLDGNEMCGGLNTNRPQPVGTYGYFFSPYANTSINPVLQQICIWLDYNLSFYNEYHENPWPKPGYPAHVPIAIPTGGNYNTWMTVRGIHTDRDGWLSYPEFPSITVYGFWLNDPKLGGLGGNTYVTAQRFQSTYFLPLNVPGDAYHTKYLTIIEPPEGITVQTGDTPVIFIDTPAEFTTSESQFVQAVLQNPDSLKDLAYVQLIKAARYAVEQVLRYDPSDLSSQFAQTHVRGKPVIKGDECIIQFEHDAKLVFMVHILVKTGTLLEFQVSSL